MSSRFRTSLMLAAALAMGGCEREQRDPRGKPLPEDQPHVAKGDPRDSGYENVSYQLSQGQRLYGWMNCTGCHAHGGGGMGPPLMDEEWRYGGRMEDIVATILNGRPNGMPAFRGRITEQQAWQLAGYVRSLSAQPREDVMYSRPDKMSTTEPGTISEREKVKDETPALPRDEKD